MDDLFQGIVSAFPEPVACYHPQSGLLIAGVNKAFCRLFGWHYPLSQMDVLPQLPAEILGLLPHDQINDPVLVKQSFETVDKRYSFVASPHSQIVAQVEERYWFIRIVAVEEIADQAVDRLQLLSIEPEHIIHRFLESSSFSVMMTDLQHRLVYVNDVFCQSTGYDRAEILGQTPAVLKSGYMAEEDYQKLYHQLLYKGVWRGIFHNQRKDGSLFWERATLLTLRDNLGQPQYYMAVKEDITEEREADIIQQMQEERSQAVDMHLGEIMSVISHELRTPLNAIIGFSEMMTQEIFGALENPRYKEYITEIHSGGTELLSVINKMIRIAQIERGGWEMEEALIDINALLKQTLDRYQGLAQKQKIHLRHNFAPDLPRIRGDEKSFTHILRNLCSNALKFTPAEGEVQVSADITHQGQVQIIVKDSGVGFSQEDLVRVRAAFKMDLDNEKQRPFVGLGLTLVQRLAKKQGLGVDLTSSQDVGTTIAITVPATHVISPPAHQLH